MFCRTSFLQLVRQEVVLNLSRVVSVVPKVLCGCVADSSYNFQSKYYLTTARNVTNRRNNLMSERKDVDYETKTRLIKNLKLKSVDEEKAFYKLRYKTLIHIVKVTENDNKKGYCSNRLYYIADKIKCPPSVLSERIVNRTFIYSLSFDWLENSLKVLLDMGVPGDRILRDLWVLKYHHETIHERLQYVIDMGVDTLYPWMVRCSKDILDRFITISRDTKKILGDTKSPHVYLADRLNITPEELQELSSKLPALKTIRVTKVKNFIDFLIKEGYDVQDIANKPRILTASQKTVAQRLHRLRQLGLSEINLNVLCRCRKDFKKYCESMKSIKHKTTLRDPIDGNKKNKLTV